MRAVIYARVSTEEQAEKELSILSRRTSMIYGVREGNRILRMGKDKEELKNI